MDIYYVTVLRNMCWGKHGGTKCTKDLNLVNLSLNQSPSLIFMKGFCSHSYAINEMEITVHIPLTVILNGECQLLNVHISTL